MSWSTPPTFVAGTSPTAANFNVLRDDLNFLNAPPRARAYFSAGTQTLTTAVAAAGAGGDEDTDTDTMHSTVTNTSRLTIVTAGRYRVTGSVGFAANATGYRAVYLRKTGTTMAETRLSSSQASVRHTQQCIDEILCVAGDYLEVWAEQGSGGNLNLAAGQSVTFLHAVWVSST